MFGKASGAAPSSGAPAASFGGKPPASFGAFGKAPATTPAGGVPGFGGAKKATAQPPVFMPPSSTTPQAGQSITSTTNTQQAGHSNLAQSTNSVGPPAAKPAAPGTQQAAAPTTAPSQPTAIPAATPSTTPKIGTFFTAAKPTGLGGAAAGPTQGGAPSTQAAAAAPSATATTTTPKVGLGGIKSAASITSAPASAVAAKPLIDVSGLLKGKTLEDIINDWNNQIEDDIYQFTQVALLVSDWDKKVSSNSKKILDLKQKVDLVYSAQDELKKNLDLIHSQQSQLDMALTSLEESVQSWSQTAPLASLDNEREAGYSLACNVDAQLNDMSGKLKDMINRLNATQDREPDSPTYQILSILDSHLNSLDWIDKTSRELASKLEEKINSTKKKR